MFDPNQDSGKAVVVAVGLLAGHLFLYGRKVKKNVKIASRELVGDAMQFGAMFVGAMGFHSALSAMGYGTKDVWQTVTMTIIFCMSFDTYVQKFREAADGRFKAVVQAIFGKIPEESAVVASGKGGGLPAKIKIVTPKRETPEERTRDIAQKVVNRMENTNPIEDDDKAMKDLLDKLDEEE